MSVDYRMLFFKFVITIPVILSVGYYPHLMTLTSFQAYQFSCSYVCHAEVNAILNTNHASAAGQVSLNLDL